MKERIELIQLTQKVDDPATLWHVVDSVRMPGYKYVVTPAAFSQLATAYASDEEAEESWAEDRTGWMVELFDAGNLADFEERLVNYFGSEQKALAFMTVGSPLRGNMMEEGEHHQAGAGSEDVVAEEEEESSVEDTIKYLLTVEETKMQEVFLGLFSKMAPGRDNVLTSVLYQDLLKSVLRASELAADSTTELVAEIVEIFIEKMNGGQ
jgi:hypothetical protein